MTAEMLTRCGIGKVMRVFFYFFIVDRPVIFIKSWIQFHSVGFAQIKKYHEESIQEQHLSKHHK